MTTDDFKRLGQTNSVDVMKLRIECFTYGINRGASYFHIIKDIIEILLESGFGAIDMSNLLHVPKVHFFAECVSLT